MPIMTMLETSRGPFSVSFSVPRSLSFHVLRAVDPDRGVRSAPVQSASRSRATMIWPTISPGVRLRTRRCVPVWQNEQVSVQPTWLERQSVPRSGSGI
jgi:hypothetical protein